MIYRSATLAAVLICRLLSTTAQADPGEKLPGKVFLGYVSGSSRGINYKLYTHLAHAFVTADAEGKIRANPNVPSRELTTEAHKAGVQVILSLGGWGYDKQFGEIATHPEAEERYVSSVLGLVDDFDYDGIDFDWEYPDTEAEVVGFERMTRAFRAGVDAIGKAKNRTMRLTMAASSNVGTLRWLKTDFLLETIDWINVMTYDYAGDWTSFAGHNAPLFASSKEPGGLMRSTSATLEHLLVDRKIPADRLAMGIPLYGRGFNVAEPYASTKEVAKKPIPNGNYANLAKLQAQGWTRAWDDETKTPWLIAPDQSAVIGFDDAESVKLKTEWATQKGLRGVFFWQVAADRLPDGTHPLQEASHQVWAADKRP